MRIRYMQIQKNGTVWGSEVLDVEERDVRHGVITGYIMGETRWAFESGTGRFIFGMDAKGMEIKTHPKL